MTKALCSAVAFAVFFGACAASCTPKSTERLHVSVSIFPIYDLTRRVAGPNADVALLLAPGRSEDPFDPTPNETGAVSASRLVVMVGLGLDPWMEKLARDAAPKARVLKVGERVPTLRIDGDDAHLDPHVWLDPARARVLVKAIGDELARVDAAHASAYRKRASEIDASLEALDEEVSLTTKGWKTRDLITFHRSFGYFADRYGLRIVAVIEPFPGIPPTAKHIDEVVKIVSEKKIPALFSEPQIDARAAKAISDAAHVPLGVLDAIGGGPETDSYEKMIRFDVAALDKVLR